MAFFSEDEPQARKWMQAGWSSGALFMDDLDAGEVYAHQSHRSSVFSVDGELFADNRDREFPGRATNPKARYRPRCSWSNVRLEGQRHKISTTPGRWL